MNGWKHDQIRASYYERLEKATAPDATAEDRLRLFDWFEQMNEPWNGECYTIDGFRNIYPIYEPFGEPDEDGDYEHYVLIDAEIR